MPRKTVALTAAERRQIEAKFSLTPAKIAAEMAKAGKPARKKAAGGRTAPAMAAWGEPERKFYSDFPVGAFEGEPYLVWVKPDIFRMEPHRPRFRFIRSTGEAIEPGRMFTDGGSIPRALWFIKDLSPWTYAPAFLVHDWLFDQHHAGATDKSFEEVRDIMLEGVRTLMETGVCESNRLVFDLIYSGIDSFVARRIWDGKK
jgi:hypothetical protein